MDEDKTLQGLTDFQPLLKIHRDDQETIVTGTYQINESIYGEQFLESFNVRISFTSKYPQDIPCVFINDDRLDSCEHRYPNEMLCLETEHNLRAFLNEEPTLREFLTKFLTVFFVNYLYYEKYGEYIFGERQHGDEGIVEMYQERFDTTDIKLVFSLLKIVANKEYRGHVLCPCNSGKRIRRCHGKNGLLLNMINSPNQKFYTADFNYFAEKYQKKSGMS